jgi:hypothetical protein
MASSSEAAMLDSLHPSILRHFARIEDPRQNAKVLHPLAEVLRLERFQATPRYTTSTSF